MRKSGSGDIAIVTGGRDFHFRFDENTFLHVSQIIKLNFSKAYPVCYTIPCWNQSGINQVSFKGFLE